MKKPTTKTSIAMGALMVALLPIISCVNHPVEPTPPTIPAVSAAIDQCIAQHEIAGAVTLVASRDKVVHLEASGMADVASGIPMRTDAIFWIASITATAILMLQEEGKLSIEDPVAKYIPELASLKTPSGKPANLTLRHLLTHTSGMPEATGEQYKSARTLADLIPSSIPKRLSS